MKDDADWKSLGIKEGHTFMLMGSAEEVKAPTEKIVFMEDLTEDQATAMQQVIRLQSAFNLALGCFPSRTHKSWKHLLHELHFAMHEGCARIGRRSQKVQSHFQNRSTRKVSRQFTRGRYFK